MLKNSTILITGGGSGIGEALAIQLATDNKVVICGRNEEKLKTVASKNKNITYEVADISEPLWQGRLEDILQHKKELRPTDLDNRKNYRG